ncbi:MAG: hypothetical protein AB7L13_07585 [Acidimicrobiia bacterium]
MSEYTLPEGYPLKAAGIDDYPIKIGQVLFTMVDPHKGFEKAYNRWYERDHYYAGCMIGAAWFAGSRWVAPRELKDLRFPNPSPFAEPLDAGSYLSIYWTLKDWTEEQQAWGGTQVWWLYSNNRGFAERTHAHTGMYNYESAFNSNDDGVPVELALDYGYDAIGVVSVEPNAGVSHDELRDALAGVASSTLFDEGPKGPVRTVANIGAISMERPDGAESPMSLGTNGGTLDRVLQICFVEGDIRQCWGKFKAYAAAIEATGKGKVSFAAPFFRTKTGSDNYVNDLW